MKLVICILAAAVALAARPAAAAIVEIQVFPPPVLPASESGEGAEPRPQSNLLLLRNLGTAMDQAAGMLTSGPGLSEAKNGQSLFDVDLFGIGQARPDSTGPLNTP